MLQQQTDKHAKRRQTSKVMILTISEAARRAGVARSTLYEMKLRGQLSFSKTLTGKQGIDLSELARLFPHVLSKGQTVQTKPDINIQNFLDRELSYLKEKIERLEKDLLEEKRRGLKSEERLDALLQLTQEQARQLLLTHQPKGFFQFFSKRNKL